MPGQEKKTVVFFFVVFIYVIYFSLGVKALLVAFIFLFKNKEEEKVSKMKSLLMTILFLVLPYYYSAVLALGGQFGLLQILKRRFLVIGSVLEGEIEQAEAAYGNPLMLKEEDDLSSVKNGGKIGRKNRK